MRLPSQPLTKLNITSISLNSYSLFSADMLDYKEPTSPVSIQQYKFYYSVVLLAL